MNLGFDNAWPLLLLSLIPLIWWARRRTLTNFHPHQLLLQSLARALALTALVLALAQPTATWRGHQVAVVYAVDVSNSVARQSVDDALAWIDATNAAARPSASAVVLVSKTAAGFASTDDARRFLAGNAPSLDRGVTNLEEGVREALRRFPAGHLKRLVLLTDGRENAGRLASQLARLQAEGVRTFTRPLATSGGEDAWLDELEAHDVVSVDEPLSVRVGVYSLTDRAADVDLLQGEKLLVTRHVALTRGLNTLDLDTRLTGEGPSLLTAVVRAQGDRLEANNRLRRAVFVEPKPRVLYVEGVPRSARYLVGALEQSGFLVDLASPQALPSSANRLRGYGAVIVSDVARSQFHDAQMKAIKSYVADQGGGFILIGGEAVYGKDGYAGTIAEDILPVTFDMKDKPDEFAMVVVLDKSWSMSGPKMELSKEAAKAAVDVLDDSHQFALVAFNNAFDWPIPMTSAKNRVSIKERISMITPSGHTNIYPALEEAFKALLKVDAKNKHVILLSDGRTYTDDFEGLTTRMVNAKITVSTVSVGEQADRELLADIARWGKGRTYYIEDANAVPQIFSEETQKAAKPTLVEEPFRPAVEKAVEMFKGIDFTRAPKLKGYTNTQSKETAELLLVAADREPILARWQYGLGRTVAFLSDVKDRWASDWLAWDGYGKFWSQLVRESVREDADRARRLRVDRTGDRVRVAVETIDPDGRFRNLSVPRVEMSGPDGAASMLAMAQVGPGAYEAQVPISPAADYTFRLVEEGRANADARALPAVYDRELRAYPPDEALLQQISRDTGGVFNPDAAAIVAGYDDTVPVGRELWPWCAALALAAYLVDLLLRRVRLFEAIAS